MKNGPAKLLYAVGVRDLEALKCKEHEQADTGIFVHIGFSAKKSTDILFFGIYHSAVIHGLTELGIPLDITSFQQLLQLHKLRHSICLCTYWLWHNKLHFQL